MLASDSGLALVTTQISSGVQKSHGCCVNDSSGHFQMPVCEERSPAGSSVRAVAPLVLSVQASYFFPFLPHLLQPQIKRKGKSCKL